MWVAAFLFLWCFHDIGKKSCILSREPPRRLQPSSAHQNPHNFGDTNLSDEPHAGPSRVNQTCSFCSSTFASRNKLFRHVREDPNCSLLAFAGRKIETARVSLLLSFGYIGCVDAEGLLETLKDALEMVAHSAFNETDVDIELVSFTLASDAKLRHRSLSQEDGTAAAGDVIVANFQVPKLMTCSMWEQALDHARASIEDRRISVTACKLLDSDSKLLDVERSCTQRVYHYLLPVSWLPNGLELERWWKSGNETIISGRSNQRSKRPPLSLRLLKDSLRTAESSEARSADLGSRHSRFALGRFGALGFKKRRPWHNYADPTLRGDASPNNEPVWRCVDRARVVDFVQAGRLGEICAVLEFRGDNFLKQQVRRIVGSTVAMAHGWLPRDFITTSTRSDSVIETPLAPVGRLYLAELRFHFEEMRTLGSSLFECNSGGPIIAPLDVPHGVKWAQTLLLNDLARPSIRASERNWLKDLEITISPRILKQLTLRERTLAQTLKSSFGNDACQHLYLPVLAELRNIVATGNWPETSAARSAVIRNKEELKLGVRSNGSFTVVNPRFEKTVEKLPLGNFLFSDLVDSIFTLEEQLSDQIRDRTAVDQRESDDFARRPPSSHCAVNCNAEFTPHVDSGTGAGQTLSMIVGLGNYTGGGLYVEGELLDIRFKPVEFDGWSLRHWTERFEGERFSLVWFTPEAKGSSKNERN